MARDTHLTIPGRPSKEADKHQLKLAREQGQTYTQALEDMEGETGKGRSKKIHDYIITLTEEGAEGMYVWEGDQLVWRNPERENAHFEVSVRDALDQRFIPYLDVTLEIFNHANERLICEKVPFVWHSWLFHYGINVELPGSGAYHVQVSVEPLRVARHDRRNGCRFTREANVRFENFEVRTGRKLN